MFKLTSSIFLQRCLLVIGLALAFQVISLAGTARAEVAPDEQPLSTAEMASLCGGFTLPNGVNINVGIDNQVSINGTEVADAQFSLNGTSIKTTASGQSQIQGAGGSTNILQLAGIGPTVISNSANNITLSQLRTINVDVSNYSKINMQALTGIAAIQGQILNGLRNSIH